MKFYKDNNDWRYRDKIRRNKLTAIYTNNIIIAFLKNGKYHNSKNAAYISTYGTKEFFLNDKYYRTNTFTKLSWRKFAKLQVFL